MCKGLFGRQSGLQKASTAKPDRQSFNIVAFLMIMMGRDLVGPEELKMFSPEFLGYQYQTYDRSRVRALCIALGDSLQKDAVREFSQRLMRELCGSTSPNMSSRTFWQLARWCKTGGAYEEGMDHAQRISIAVFGRIIERR